MLKQRLLLTPCLVRALVQLLLPSELLKPSVLGPRESCPFSRTRTGLLPPIHLQLAAFGSLTSPSWTSAVVLAFSSMLQALLQLKTQLLSRCQAASTQFVRSAALSGCSPHRGLPVPTAKMAYQQAYIAVLRQ